MANLPTHYSIRFAAQGDIPACIAADRAASELFRPTGLIPDMATIPESVPADVFSKAISDGMVLTAIHSDVPVGFALCRCIEATLYLDQLSVDPAHGQQGIGRALVEHVIMLAEEHDAEAVILSTFRDLAWNGPFYRKLGFKELKRSKMTNWMLEIETAQAETLDVSKRCFMVRPVKKSLLSWVS